MTSSWHAPTSTRGTARLDIWTVNVTEPVSMAALCLSSREPVPAICRPAALLAHLCPLCHLAPGMSETRSLASHLDWGIRCIGLQMPQQPQTTKNLGKKYLIGAGSKWWWLWCWVIMSDMMGGGSHLPARAGQARGISAQQLPSRAEQSSAEQSRAEQNTITTITTETETAI